MFKSITCEKIKGMLEFHIYSVFFDDPPEKKFVIEMKRGSNTALTDVIVLEDNTKFVEVNSSLTCDATFFYSKSDKKFIEKKMHQKIKSVDKKGNPDKTLGRWECDISKILNDNQLEFSIEDLAMKVEGGKSKGTNIILDTIIQMTMQEADIKKQNLTGMLSQLMESKLPLQIPDEIEQALDDTFANTMKNMSKKELIRHVEQLKEDNMNLRKKCKDQKEKAKNAIKKTSMMNSQNLSQNLSVITENKNESILQPTTSDMSFFLTQNMPSRTEMEIQQVLTKNDLAMLIDRIADTKNWNILNPIRNQLNFLREDSR